VLFVVAGDDGGAKRIVKLLPLLIDGCVLTSNGDKRSAVLEFPTINNRSF